MVNVIVFNNDINFNLIVLMGGAKYIICTPHRYCIMLCIVLETLVYIHCVWAYVV